MENVILIVVLLMIIGLAVAYIIKEKKRGVKCIGCPAAGTCAQGTGEGSSCGGNCSSCQSCAGKSHKGDEQ